MGKKRNRDGGEVQGGGSSGSAGPSRNEEREGNSKMSQDPRMRQLVKKFKLDEAAENKLADVLSRWDEDKQYRYFKELRHVLGEAVRPSATVMIMVKKIVAGERLCELEDDSDESEDYSTRKNPRNITAGQFKAQRGMGTNARIAARAMHEGAQRLRQELQANLVQQMRSQMGSKR
eukprot:gb/GFBE01062107.1/.p1 GENE.gb/GFBE01062107.1/~~gb/GFBE01062107.1/.p1  ORF type:complete len:176 (+),score=41.44 gb/GFBE01062107.1/:1-528(+)